MLYKMKTLLVLFIFTLSDAKNIRGRVQQEYSKSIDITNLDCSGSQILPIVSSNPHFSAALSALGPNAKSTIDGLCIESRERNLQEEEPVPFSHVTARGRQFDKNFFDGGTSWNNGLGDTSKEEDAGRILAVADTLKSRPLQWPSHIVNFDDTESCALNTVTCCWTKARDPTSRDIVNISDESSTNSPQPNSDVCMVNMDRSPQAGHVADGLTFYSEGEDVEGQEEDAYCVGFSYTDEATDVSTRYRANTLLHIAMLDGFYGKDLVGSVPGAPMCGCVEQMPVVSFAACREPVISRRLVVGPDDRLLIETPIEIEACDQDDLVADSNNPAALAEYITGSCPNTLDSYLGSIGMKRGDAWWHADRAHWTPILGQDDLYHPEMSIEDLNAAYASSSTKVIRRICKSCAPSHRDIYYTRITPFPEGFDLLNFLKDKFSSENNVFGVDFTLSSKDKYGTITPWTYCKFSDIHGFPYECGPTEAVEKQWTSFTYSGTYAEHFAFYIEK